jgi:hypothetical protein
MLKYRPWISGFFALGERFGLFGHDAWAVNKARNPEVKSEILILSVKEIFS